MESGSKKKNPVANLTKAVEAVRSGIKLPLAALKYNIPVSILFNRISAIRRMKMMNSLPGASKNFESQTVVENEVPDKDGLIADEKVFRYRLLSNTERKGVPASEKVSNAIAYVFQGGSLLKAANKYNIDKRVLLRKMRAMRMIKTRQSPTKPGCTSKEPDSVNEVVRTFSPVSEADPVSDIVGKMGSKYSLHFPKTFVNSVNDLEDGIHVEVVQEKYSFDMMTFEHIIKLLRQTKTSSPVTVSLLGDKIYKLLQEFDPSYSAPPPKPLYWNPTKRRKFDMSNLVKGIRLINSGMSITGASRTARVPYTTLYKHATGKKYEKGKSTKKRKSCQNAGSSEHRGSSYSFTKNQFEHLLKEKLEESESSVPKSDDAVTMKGKCQKTLLCMFCQQPGGREVELGKLHVISEVVVHYYCLLFSSALEQNGQDDEGILGFLPKDIVKELNRGKKLKCCYCGLKGATIGCNSKMCKKTYHFPCGLDSFAQYIFTDNFSSMCVKHRKFQIGSNKGQEVECPICMEVMIANPKFAVWSPCCRKSSWFHRVCLQKLALSAGYFFKCPLCNDKNTFVPEMLRQGIFVPEQDASWELEPNAFQELLERPIRCDAPKCKCPGGRKSDEEGTRWEVLLCNLCGSTGIHITCGRLKFNCSEWNCPTCTEMLRESALRAQQENRGRRVRGRRGRKMKRGATSDGENDCTTEEERDDDDTPSEAKKRRVSSRFRPSSSSSPVLAIAGKDEYVPVDDKTPQPSSSRSSPFVRASDDEDDDNDDDNNDDSNIGDEILIPHGIRGDVVISELVMEGKALSDVLHEMKSYAEGLPMKLVKSRFDETSFLDTLNGFTDGIDGAYKLNKNHLKRFIRCTFNYDQMRLLRKVFEQCFIIHIFKTKISKNQRDAKANPFSGKRFRTGSTSSHVKKMKALQKSMANLLTKAKTGNLLEGNNTWSSYYGYRSGLLPEDQDQKRSDESLLEEMPSTSRAASDLDSEPSTSQSARYDFCNTILNSDETPKRRAALSVKTCHLTLLERVGKSNYSKGKTRNLGVNGTSSPTRKSLRLLKSSFPPSVDSTLVFNDIEIAEKNFLKQLQLRSKTFGSGVPNREKENRGSESSLAPNEYPPSDLSPSFKTNSSLLSVPLSPPPPPSSPPSSSSPSSSPRKCSPLQTSHLQNKSLNFSPPHSPPSQPSSTYIKDIKEILSESEIKELNMLRTPTPPPPPRLARNLFEIQAPSPSSHPTKTEPLHRHSSLPKLTLFGVQLKNAKPTNRKKRKCQKKKDRYIQPTISSYFRIQPNRK